MGKAVAKVALMEKPREGDAKLKCRRPPCRSCSIAIDHGSHKIRSSIRSTSWVITDKHGSFAPRLARSARIANLVSAYRGDALRGHGGSFRKMIKTHASAHGEANDTLLQFLWYVDNGVGFKICDKWAWHIINLSHKLYFVH